MDKLVINDTHYEDQDAKSPLHPLNKTVTHQFVATDKHQRLFIYLVRGNLHIDEVSHFFLCEQDRCTVWRVTWFDAVTFKPQS